MDDDIIDKTIKEYIRKYDDYKKLTDIVFDICQNIVQKNLTIRATVQHRTKSPTSLAEKLTKIIKYDTAQSVLEHIVDLAGVRIITYQESDRPKVVEVLEQVFIGKNNEKVKVEIKDKNGMNGKYYKATHCQVTLPAEYICGNTNLKDMVCEIQVCSLLSHVYNEIEHDLQYKPKSGSLSKDEKLLIDQLGLITRSGDITIHKLLEATNERLRLHKGKFVDVHDFIIRMGELLKIGRDFSINAGLLYDELVTLKLNSPEIIIAALLNKGENIRKVFEEEFNKLNEYIHSSNINIKLNKNSSDPLLIILLRKKADTILIHHANLSEDSASSRLLIIAQAYKNMLSVE